MNSRERVLCAINHGESDRVPIFSPNLISTYEPLDPRVQHLLDTFPFDRFENLAFIEGPSRRRELPGELYEDGYGCRYQYKGVGLPYCVFRPLAEAQTVDDVERFPWPDPMSPGLLQTDARNAHASYAPPRPMPPSSTWTCSFTNTPTCGALTNGFIDLKLNPSLHRAIADRIHHINVTSGHAPAGASRRVHRHCRHRR